MSENRRKRRIKERIKPHSNISRNDKTYGILVMVLLFVITVLLVFFFALKGINIR